MTAYYNEIDPFCAEWIRRLISAGALADGEVDERDIRDVTPSDLKGFTQCHFFAGIGVWSYAARCAGWPDDRPLWTGSCPCQPFSAAGARNGFADERHLWPYWHYLVEECEPSVVAGEQVASKDGLIWLDLVSSDMEGSGYAFGQTNLSAAGYGASHIRQRTYWVADAEWGEQSRPQPCSRTIRRMGRVKQSVPWDRPWAVALAEFRVLDDGIARSVATTDAYRNAIAAPVAQAFLESVLEIQAEGAL